MVAFSASRTSITSALRASSARQFSASARSQAKFELPALPYAYNALEPAISEQIMTTHHKKHHQTYINGLNAAEENYAKAVSANDIGKQIALQSAINFWRNLAPTGSAETKGPSGSLEQAINKSFGSLEDFKTKFNATAATIQGSGWTWLGAAEDGSLKIEVTKDQDPLVSATPVLGVDCWEHAWYLDYLNVKADYFKAIWSVINWKEASARYDAAHK